MGDDVPALPPFVKSAACHAAAFRFVPSTGGLVRKFPYSDELGAHLKRDRDKLQFVSQLKKGYNVHDIS